MRNTKNDLENTEKMQNMKNGSENVEKILENYREICGKCFRNFW